MEALREQHRFTHCHTVSESHARTHTGLDLHPDLVKTAVFHEDYNFLQCTSLSCNAVKKGTILSTMTVHLEHELLGYSCQTDPYSDLAVWACVRSSVCVFLRYPLVLPTNLWGFIRRLDKDCHRLERVHTRKSPMLHCGPTSYAEKTIWGACLLAHTPTQSNTMETRHHCQFTEIQQ